jgi:hypothetical protein
MQRLDTGIKTTPNQNLIARCIGHVNKMDSKRKVSQVFNNNPQREVH